MPFYGSKPIKYKEKWAFLALKDVIDIPGFVYYKLISKIKTLIRGAGPSKRRNHAKIRFLGIFLGAGGMHR